MASMDSMGMSLHKLQEVVKNRSVACCSAWGHKEVGRDLVTEHHHLRGDAGVNPQSKGENINRTGEAEMRGGKRGNKTD